MTRKHPRYVIFLFLGFLLIASAYACTGSGDTPAQVIERYYQALADKDQDLMITLSCGEWEANALMELDSFMNVETTLEDLTCQTINLGETEAQVTCSGAISATYDGEARLFPLSAQTYLVVQEAGEWRMCGYQ